MTTTPANTTCVSFVPIQDNEPEFGRWISIAERMPEPGREVFVLTDVGQRYIVALVDDRWWIEHGEIRGLVTHWMPLPPKETP